MRLTAPVVIPRKAGLLPPTILSKGAPWLAALALLLTSCNEKKEATATAPPPVVIVAAVEPRNVPIFDEWIARLDGSANVDVRARVQGYVQEIAFNEGTVVNEGDLLLRIDPRQYEAALAQAQAELGQAVANQEKADQAPPGSIRSMGSTESRASRLFLINPVYCGFERLFPWGSIVKQCLPTY